MKDMMVVTCKHDLKITDLVVVTRKLIFQSERCIIVLVTL